MKLVPSCVFRAGLNEEYVEALRTAEDESLPMRKRKAAKAMANQILLAAEKQQEARNEHARKAKSTQGARPP
jgi:hypothetical protein